MLYPRVLHNCEALNLELRLLPVKELTFLPERTGHIGCCIFALATGHCLLDCLVCLTRHGLRDWRTLDLSKRLLEQFLKVGQLVGHIQSNRRSVLPGDSLDEGVESLQGGIHVGLRTIVPFSSRSFWGGLVRNLHRGRLLFT